MRGPICPRIRILGLFHHFHPNAMCPRILGLFHHFHPTVSKNSWACFLPLKFIFPLDSAPPSPLDLQPKFVVLDHHYQKSSHRGLSNFFNQFSVFSDNFCGLIISSLVRIYPWQLNFKTFTFSWFSTNFLDHHQTSTSTYRVKVWSTLFYFSIF